MGVQYFFSSTLKDIKADGTSVTLPVTLSTTWGTSNTFAWHPTDPGTYTLTVIARDSTCNTSFTKTLSYTLLSSALKGITSFNPSVPSGTTLANIPPAGVLFTTLISGSGTGVLYQYKIGKLVAGTYVYAPLTAFTSSNTYLFPPSAFTPLTAGTYSVTVTACDSTYNTSFSKTTLFVIK